MPSDAIIVIGGRKNRLELIAQFDAIKRTGLDCISFADELPAIIRPLVQQHYTTGAYSTEQIVGLACEIASQRRIVGVVNWSEKDVILRNTIADALKLPGMQTSAALACRDKYQMRERLEACADLSPRFASITSFSDLTEAVLKIGFPAILKPVGGSGSRGIFEVANLHETERAFLALMEITRSSYDPVFAGFEGRMILEQKLTGPEISVEGYASPSGIQIVGITDKHLSDTYFIEEALIFPGKYPESLEREINEGTKRAVTALGIENCAFHLEGRLTPDGFRVLEVAARPAGEFITTTLIPLSGIVDHVDNCIRASIGLSCSSSTSSSVVANVIIFGQEEGTYQAIEGLEQLLALGCVEHIQMHKRPGDNIRLPPKEFVNHRVATIIIRDFDREAVDSHILWIRSNLKLRIDRHDI